ncbi:MAG: response regulator [Pseudomonadota bacterium]
MQTLTTGEVAKYCGVNLRTVIRWIDKGHLKSFKLPGRGNNRILLLEFLSFMNQYGIPIPEDFRSYTRKILIVDDEKAMANSIQRSLRVAGYETALAFDGFQAGETINSFVPALMTLDLQMPGVDGLKVIKYVREKAHLSRLNILVISGLSEEHLNRAVEAGANDTLSKPFETEILLEKVDTLLKQEKQL